MDIKSQYLDRLSDDLINTIKSKKSFFDTTFIVVPSFNIAEYFKAYWLKQEESILTNIKFLTFDEFVNEVVVSDSNFRIADSGILKLFILKEIYKPSFKELIKNDSLMVDYIYDGNNINQLKSLAVSEELSKLFIEYDNDLFTPSSWQKDLYIKLIEKLKKYRYITLKELFNSAKSFKKYKDNINFFGFIHLTKLEQKIIDEYQKIQKVNTFFLDTNISYDKKYTVLKAPSKEREIDLLHSEISHLLEDKNVRYSDFVVIGKNINEYTNAINRSFSQDDINFLNIPYSINTNSKKDSDTTILLNMLFAVMKNGYFTRKDLYEILNNPIVMKNRKFTNENIESVMKMIVDLHIYRNGKIADDWDYLKKRLTLSKISGIGDRDLDIISLKDRDYLPYKNISLDDDLITNFLDVIDDINNLIDLYSNKDNKFITYNNILAIKEQLNKWLSIKDEYGSESNKELFKINSIITDWLYFGLVNSGVHFNSLMEMFLNESKVRNAVNKGIYFNGVTFIDFNSDYVLPAKYVFIIGTNTNAFPSNKNKSELDQRTEVEDNSKKEKEIFLLNYVNGQEMTYISYLISDIKSDEELFPSSFLTDLEAKKDPEAVKEIFIDETRSWEELYTFKEYRNKEYYSSLLMESTSNKKEIPYIEIANDGITTYSIKNLATFLKEPMQFKAGNLFYRKRELLDDIKDEYESFNLDRFTGKDLFKTLFIKLLKEKANIDDINFLNGIKKELFLDNKLSNINKDIDEELFDEVLKQVKTKVELIAKEDNYEVISMPDIKLSNGTDEWVIQQSEEIIKCKVNDNYFKYYDTNAIKDKQTFDSYYLNLYINSLIDISLLNNELTYKIELVNNAKYSKSFNVIPNKAKEILIKICSLIDDNSSFKAVPLDEYKNKDKQTLYKFGHSLVQENHSSWSYFKDRQLFNYETDLGYDANNFDNEIKNEYHNLENLVLYLNGGGSKNE